MIRLQNIGHGEFRDVNKAYIAPDHYATLGGHDVRGGDVLVAGLGDARRPAGRACVAPDHIAPAMVKADCFRFRLRDGRVEERFAALHLTATARDSSAALSAGATRQRTNLQSMAARAIAVPPLNEQLEIVECVSEQTEAIAEGACAAERQIGLLAECRSRLIGDVVTGRLDVCEAATRLRGVESEHSEEGEAALVDEEGLEDGVSHLARTAE